MHACMGRQFHTFDFNSTLLEYSHTTEYFDYRYHRYGEDSFGPYSSTYTSTSSEYDLVHQQAYTMAKLI